MGFIESLKQDREEEALFLASLEGGAWIGCNGFDVTDRHIRQSRDIIADLDALIAAEMADAYKTQRTAPRLNPTSVVAAT